MEQSIGFWKRYFPNGNILEHTAGPLEKLPYREINAQTGVWGIPICEIPFLEARVLAEGASAFVTQSSSIARSSSTGRSYFFRYPCPNCHALSWLGRSP